MPWCDMSWLFGGKAAEPAKPKPKAPTTASGASKDAHGAARGTDAAAAAGGGSGGFFNLSVPETRPRGDTTSTAAAAAPAGGAGRAPVAAAAAAVDDDDDMFRCVGLCVWCAPPGVDTICHRARDMQRHGHGRRRRRGGGGGRCSGTDSVRLTRVLLFNGRWWCGRQWGRRRRGVGWIPCRVRARARSCCGPSRRLRVQLSHTRASDCCFGCCCYDSARAISR